VTTTPPPFVGGCKAKNSRPEGPQRNDTLDTFGLLQAIGRAKDADKVFPDKKLRKYAEKMYLTSSHALWH
jgi:hypothetical protein